MHTPKRGGAIPTNRGVCRAAEENGHGDGRSDTSPSTVLCGVNAGEILQRLAGGKVQQVLKQ